MKPLNWPGLLRTAAIIGLGIAAGCLAFRSDAASTHATGPGQLVFVNGKLAHATRIEEGAGVPDYMPRDTNGAFSVVSLEMDAQVLLKVGPKYEVRVSTERNLQKYIQTTRVGAQLLISTTGSYSTRNPVKVEISVPSLTELDVSGNGRVQLQGDFGQALAVDEEGGWVLTGKGQVRALDLTVSDSSSVSLAEFDARDITVRGSSSAALTLHARESIRGDLQGHPAVTVYGQPVRHALNLGKGGTLRLAG